MCNEKPSKVSAVIYIGSYDVRMKISQNYKGKISDLERLEYPVDIGHDIFTTGKISFDTIGKIVSIIIKITEYRINLIFFI